MKKNYIGVDIGKTKIIVALVDSKGKLSYREQVSTDMLNGGYHIINQVISLIQNVIKKSNNNFLSISGIGIGASGVIDHKKGIIVSSGSIPNWENIEITKLLSEKFNLPVLIDNDVYVGALGEHYFGINKKYNNSIFFSISTGVGLAIIQDGKIIHGSNNISGQIAHLSIFNDKTVNDLFSGSGISAIASKKFKKEISTENVFKEAKSGNKEAQNIIYEASKHASIIVSLLQTTIDPEVFILGGSVAINNDQFIEDIKSQSINYLKKYQNSLSNGLTFEKAKLGIDSVVVGSIALFK